MVGEGAKDYITHDAVEWVAIQLCCVEKGWLPMSSTSLHPPSFSLTGKEKKNISVAFKV